MADSAENRRRAYELDPDKVLETISSLLMRIEERFPGCGLSRVAREMVAIGKAARERIDWIGRPIWWVRAVTCLVIAGQKIMILESLNSQMQNADV